MSIAVYVGPNRPNERLTKGIGEDLAIQTGGLVLLGETSVTGIMKEQLFEAACMRRDEPKTNCYGSVDDYDPVLVDHCRL